MSELKEHLDEEISHHEKSIQQHQVLYDVLCLYLWSIKKRTGIGHRLFRQSI
jgi:hypothetical protein